MCHQGQIQPKCAMRGTGSLPGSMGDPVRKPHTASSCSITSIQRQRPVLAALTVSLLKLYPSHCLLTLLHSKWASVIRACTPDRAPTAQTVISNSTRAAAVQPGGDSDSSAEEAVALGSARENHNYLVSVAKAMLMSSVTALIWTNSLIVTLVKFLYRCGTHSLDGSPCSAHTSPVATFTTRKRQSVP